MRQAFPRRDIAIFATRATRARHSRYPNTYFFQATLGNGVSFRYDWTVEIIRLFFSRIFFALPFLVVSLHRHRLPFFFSYLALCNPIFFLFPWIILYVRIAQRNDIPNVALIPVASTWDFARTENGIFRKYLLFRKSSLEFWDNNGSF